MIRVLRFFRDLIVSDLHGLLYFNILYENQKKEQKTNPRKQKLGRLGPSSACQAALVIGVVGVEVGGGVVVVMTRSVHHHQLQELFKRKQIFESNSTQTEWFMYDIHVWLGSQIP
jgi:hypothetical protein